MRRASQVFLLVVLLTLFSVVPSVYGQFPVHQGFDCSYEGREFIGIYGNFFLGADALRDYAVKVGLDESEQLASAFDSFFCAFDGSCSQDYSPSDVEIERRWEERTRTACELFTALSVESQVSPGWMVLFESFIVDNVVPPEQEILTARQDSGNRITPSDPASAFHRPGSAFAFICFALAFLALLLNQFEKTEQTAEERNGEGDSL